MRKSLLVTVGLVLLIVSAAEAKPAKEEMYKLFSEANEAFRQANSTGDTDKAEGLYEQAILGYERIISEGGIRNAKLYYNLANAYFLKADIGGAILNYRRAERLDKADGNIQKNLAFARSKRIDEVAVRAERRVLETLFFWHWDFSLKTRSVLLCLFFAVLCVGLTVAIWMGRNAASTVVSVVAGVVVICMGVSVVLGVREQQRLVCGVIMGAEVVGRQGDGNNYAASFKDALHPGTEFDLLEHRLGWFHIELSDGSDAWVPDGSAELI